MEYNANQILLDKLKKMECADSTSPSKPPFVLSHSSGNDVFDAGGNKYLDFITGFGSLGLGHNHPKLVSAMENYLQQKGAWQGLGDLFAAEPKVALAEKILQHLPDKFSRVSFSLSGSDAIATAIKTLQLKTKAQGFLALEDCYHGVEFGPLSLTHNPYFKGDFVDHNPNIKYIKVHEDKKLLIEKVTELKSQNNFAGLIVEPVLGRGGLRKLDFAWLQDVYKIVRDHDGYVIFDEILCGLGRCGRFSFTKDVDADITCFGKNLGGGMPVSACVGTEEVMSAWPESPGEAKHTGTFYGHALSCYMALENMKIHDELNLYNAGIKSEKWLTEILTKHLNKYQKHIKEIRVCGFWAVVELHEKGLGVKVVDQCREHGLLCLPCGVHGESISLIPSFTITQEEFNHGCSIIAKTISHL